MTDARISILHMLTSPTVSNIIKEGHTKEVYDNLLSLVFHGELKVNGLENFNKVTSLLAVYGLSSTYTSNSFVGYGYSDSYVEYHIVLPF